MSSVTSAKNPSVLFYIKGLEFRPARLYGSTQGVNSHLQELKISVYHSAALESLNSETMRLLT
jgi:hypothetical protein